MTTKITTDWHINAKRVGGTTPKTQLQLKQHLMSALAGQLDDNDHIIAGDLFDTFTVEINDVIDLYSLFATWLEAYGRRLVLLRGNHDFSERAAARSSFDLLGHILKDRFPTQVVVADTVTNWEQFILVPHLANNDLLGLEIEKLKKVKGKVIVFHANADNLHAADSQHSLNVTREQIDALSRKNLLIFGHEHQHRKLNNGRCLVLGNGAPSSIADCLGHDKKYAAMVDGTDYELVPIWNRDDEYGEYDWKDVDWRDTDDYEKKFIRITGEATASQAGDVINTVAKYRQHSNALVIGNAVVVEGAASFEEIEGKNVETIKAFDVVGAIMESLDEKEREVVKGLLNAT